MFFIEKEKEDESSDKLGYHWISKWDWITQFMIDILATITWKKSLPDKQINNSLIKSHWLR